MIISVPKLHNAGIGNIIFPLAKSYLASQALNCHLMIPYQLDTKRLKIYFNPVKMGYMPYFPNPMKKLRFTFEEYIKTCSLTETNDYFTNVKAFSDAVDLRNKIIVSEGMWGGYEAIYRARKWIKTLLTANKHSRRNISAFSCRYHKNRIQIGFHLRRGDFKAPSQNFADTKPSWNVQTPISWFVYIAEILSKELGKKNLDFILFTDSPDHDDIKLYKKNHNLLCIEPRFSNVYSDLYLMSECDLLVCSKSSYSMLAAFLSESPYLMYKEALFKKSGKFFLWDEEIYNFPSDSTCCKPRGFICGNENDLDEELLNYLNNKIISRNSQPCELIYGGRN